MQITPADGEADRGAERRQHLHRRGPRRPRHQHPLRHLLPALSDREVRRQQDRGARRLQRGGDQRRCLGRLRSLAGTTSSSTRPGNTSTACSKSRRITPTTTARSWDLSRVCGREAGVREGILIALACAAALSAGLASSSATAAPRARPSIIGGAAANPAQWTFAAAIFRKGHLHCGGSVISPTRVLTAAHCVLGFDLASFAVIANRPDLRSGASGEVLGVASARIHPDYESTGLHDVAVLNLSRPTTAAPDRPDERRRGRRDHPGRRAAQGRRLGSAESPRACGSPRSSGRPPRGCGTVAAASRPTPATSSTRR